MRFSVTRRQGDDQVVTLSPAGEIDLGTAGALRAAIADTLHTPHPVDVVVDLGQVMFLDCAGIGALVAGRNTAVRRGRGYTVVNPQRPVRRVLDITGVHAALTVRPDPAPPTGQPIRSPRSGHRRHDRPVAAGPPAPSTADASALASRRIRVGDGEMAVDGACRWCAEPRAQRLESPQHVHRRVVDVRTCYVRP